MLTEGRDYVDYSTIDKIDRRTGHLIETVHLAAKYMINMDKGDEDSIIGYSATLILEYFKDPLFKVYQNDKNMLESDIKKVLNIMKDQKIFSKDKNSNIYTPPGNSSKVESVLTYDTKIGQIVDYTKFEPLIINL